MTDTEKKLAFLLATSPHLDTADGSYDEAARDLVANGVVPVVRCGLCKHWDKEGLYCHHPAGLSFCGKTGAAKGFCYFGERRADEC